MTETYYGTTHVFTSRDSSSVITIKAGAGETLNIEGAGATQINSDLAGGNPLVNPPVNLQDPEVTRLVSQGTTVAVAQTVNDVVVIASSPGVYDTDIPSLKGGMTVYRNNLGAGFLKGVTLVAQITTASQTIGEFCDITEDGALATISGTHSGGAQLQLISVYQHDAGWNWSNLGLSTDFTSGMVSHRISNVSGSTGAYMIGVNNTGFLSIAFYNGAAWTAQLISVATGIPKNYMIGINSSASVAVYYDGAFIKCLLRTGTTWTTNFLNIGITGCLSLEYKGSILVASNATTIFVYEFAAGTFTLTNSIALANVKQVRTNGVQIFALTATAVQAYTKQAGLWTANGVAEPTTTVLTTPSMDCSSGYLAIGKPTANTYGSTDVYPIVAYTPGPVYQNLVDTDQTNMILTSYKGFVDVQEKLKCVDLEVVNNIVKSSYPVITQPTVPVSTWAYANEFNHTMVVYITGGTVSAITVNGVATGLTSGTFVLPFRGTIAITYTVVPTWKWFYGD